jgi:hypothetical protein
LAEIYPEKTKEKRHAMFNLYQTNLL